MICPDSEVPATLWPRLSQHCTHALAGIRVESKPQPGVRGGVRMGASVSAFWRKLKLCWPCGVQVKSQSFCSRWRRGATVQEKPHTNFL